MENKKFILKGSICYSTDKDTMHTLEDGYLVCEDGICKGVFETLPSGYEGLPITDYGKKILIPGLVDLHIHAPQYTFRARKMDLELLDWLNEVTFPEEAKYADEEFAKQVYSIFADSMKHSATTRACIFATIHNQATRHLMDLMEATGIKSMVGKVNMDRNAPDFLLEKSAEESAANTEKWLSETLGQYENVLPIITPRFIPTCTDELMEKLKHIQMKYDLPMQSHLSENQGEIAWVKELCPDTEFYGDAYDKFGMFGRDCKTIMAHCVSSGSEEIQRMKENGVFVAHCPESNVNLSSGIAPVRVFLNEGIHVGLGSDVAGGTTESVFKAMSMAIQVSKLRWRLQDESLKPLTIEEAFYMGTKGGGTFFGNVGSFEEGFEFDVVVLDDSTLVHPYPLTVKERMERIIYLSDDRHISEKYVCGKKIL